jgi:SAM-dependent methyltransferase
MRARVLRAEIIDGARGKKLRGKPLADLIRDVTPHDRDTFADELLGFDYVPGDDQLPRGGTPYLPCGVEEILRMCREVPLSPSDVFADLGSGVGRVAILAHLVSGARSGGIEIQKALVGVARERVEALKLPDVTFVLGNALEAPLEANVYFMYSPFNGETLRQVLARLEALARTRPVVICTVDMELHAPWLVARKSTSLALTIYDARF